MRALIICFLFLSLFSCTDNRDENNPYAFVEGDKLILESGEFINSQSVQPRVLHLPTLQENMSIGCASIIDTLYSIPLQTIDKSILGYINTVQVFRDTIYVLDERKTCSLKRFNSDGTFIDQIGRQGQGPGEYVQPTNFFVDSLGIMIIDQWQSKLIKYDHSGICKSDKLVPFYASQAVRFSSNNYLFRDGRFQNDHITKMKNCCLWSTDSLFNIKYRGWYHAFENPEICSNKAMISKYHDSFIVNDGYSDSLFVINPTGEVGCKYVIDNSKNSSVKCTCDNFRYLNGYLYFQMNKYGIAGKEENVSKIYNVIYDEKNDRLFVGSTYGKADRKNLFYQLGRVLGSTDSCLIFKEYADDLCRMYKATSEDEWVETAKSFGYNGIQNFFSTCRNLNPDDNDVLLILKLK